MTIYGKQLFLHVLKNYPETIQNVFLSKKIEPRLFTKIANTCNNVIKVDNQKAQSLARGGNHQGFIANINDFEYSEFAQIKNSKFVLMLDSITDSHNIGAIIRSARVFGIDAVIIAGIQSISEEGVARTSVGAIFDIPIVLYANALDLANELKQAGFTLYGADIKGENVAKIEWQDKKAIIIGAENVGISKKLKQKLDKIITINMKTDFDSLNASVAAAIICDRITNG